MKFKSYLLIVICIFSTFILTGCNNIGGIEDKAYAIALGIDSSDTHKIKLSIQFAVLSSSEEATSSSGSQNDNSTVITVDCANINSGISLINSYISKKINLAHCKAVVISEKFASSGISDIIYTLMNNIELRPDCNILISKCSTSDFLENSNPVFESNPAEYFEMNFNSSEYTGYVDNITLSDFYYNILSASSDASAILAGLNTKESQELLKSSDNALDDNYIAGEMPITSKNSIESMGTAVFRGDKLIGELNNLETLCHLIITNNLKNATVNIPNPFGNNGNISFYINLTKKTKNKLSFVNGYPYIECEIWITGNVPTAYSSIDLSDETCINTLNDALSNYLEAHTMSYLYKTSKSLKADIASFGEYALPKYLTWQEWLDSDWLSNYSNAFFNVTVHSDIQSGYLFNKI